MRTKILKWFNHWRGVIDVPAAVPMQRQYWHDKPTPVLPPTHAYEFGRIIRLGQ